MNIKELYEFYKQHPVVTTDSRDCPEGSIFFALKGESFDGNQFALKLWKKAAHWPLSTTRIWLQTCRPRPRLQIFLKMSFPPPLGRVREGLFSSCPTC